LHDALVFTLTKHRANRLAKYLGEQGIRSSASTAPVAVAAHEALAGFKNGK